MRHLTEIKILNETYNFAEKKFNEITEKIAEISQDIANHAVYSRKLKIALKEWKSNEYFNYLLERRKTNIKAMLEKDKVKSLSQTKALIKAHFCRTQGGDLTRLKKCEIIKVKQETIQLLTSSIEYTKKRVFELKKEITRLRKKQTQEINFIIEKMQGATA